MSESHINDTAAQILAALYNERRNLTAREIYDSMPAEVRERIIQGIPDDADPVDVTAKTMYGALRTLAQDEYVGFNSTDAEGKRLSWYITAKGVDEVE